MKLAETCLQLDVGNSSAKWRLLSAGEVLGSGRYQVQDPGSRELLLACPKPEQIWISSVASSEREADLSRMLVQQWDVKPWFARSEQQTGRLGNCYAEPSRLGVDRWLAMLGAIERYSGRIAVIDAGSALTVDLVAASGQHDGGYIIPGPALMERALLLDTDRVRFDDDVGYALTPGQSTAEAVRHGIAAAQAGSVTLLLAQAGIEIEKTVFCGGGAKALMELMGRGGEYAPDLVFEGLMLMAKGVD